MSYVSKGSGRAVSKSTLKAIKRERTEAEKMMFVVDAHSKGKKVKRYGLQDLPEQRFNRFRMKGS